MISLLWRLTRGYRLRPWQSPYLKWRMETYWVIPAGRIGFREFCSLAWRLRRDFRRYLGWAVRMNRLAHSGGSAAFE